MKVDLNVVTAALVGIAGVALTTALQLITIKAALWATGVLLVAAVTLQLISAAKDRAIKVIKHHDVEYRALPMSEGEETAVVEGLFDSDDSSTDDSHANVKHILREEPAIYKEPQSASCSIHKAVQSPDYEQETPAITSSTGKTNKHRSKDEQAKAEAQKIQAWLNGVQSNSEETLAEGLAEITGKKYGEMSKSLMLVALQTYVDGTQICAARTRLKQSIASLQNDD